LLKKHRQENSRRFFTTAEFHTPFGKCLLLEAEFTNQALFFKNWRNLPMNIHFWRETRFPPKMAECAVRLAEFTHVMQYCCKIGGIYTCFEKLV